MMRSPPQVPNEFHDMPILAAALGLQLRQDIGMQVRRPIPKHLADALSRLEKPVPMSYWRRYH